MAPSTRTSATRGTKQYATIRNYAKVTKIQCVKPLKNVSAHKLQALSNIVNEEKPRAAPSQLKRKRSDEDEEGTTGEPDYTPSRKSLQFPGPPTSTWADDDKTPAPKRAKRKTPTLIPDAIEDLRDIFKYFLKAFSIHFAHNGSSSPADLGALLPTITRLYKKRNVSRDDIQRMLALFEVPIESVLPGRVLLKHTDSPFKLVVSGIGPFARHLVEYTSDSPYSEKFLIQDYGDAIETACIAGRNKSDCFIHAPVEQYPLLAYEKGAQTVVRQEKASAVRDHVLGGAPQRQQKEKDTAEPDFENLSINDRSSAEEPAQAPPSTKSRTLSLFDRVKAKQSAASLTSAPTSAELLRRHAIGRIGDVVEILRMKQNQRVNLGNLEGASTTNKVSFSMGQALTLIKSSLTVPMAEEELRMSVKILANEVPGSWLKIVEVGSFQSVIIQGQGLRGTEVRDLLQSRA